MPVLFPWGITPAWTPASPYPGLDQKTTVDAAARVNDRAHTLALTRELGCTLPGSRLLDSPEALSEHLSTHKSPSEWVLKAPLCAAGRHRLLRLRDRPEPSPKSIARLFLQHGPLLFEPWMPRTEDFGALFVVSPKDPANPLVEGPWIHRQRIDSRGGFRGIELGGPLPFTNDERLTLRNTFAHVARTLAGAGYAGPVGVDFWRWSRPGQPDALNPLGEINARLTFGWVTRALVARLMPGLQIDHSLSRGDETNQTVARLCFGNAPQLLSAQQERDGHIRPLLLTGDDGITAWLESGSP